MSTPLLPEVVWTKIREWLQAGGSGEFVLRKGDGQVVGYSSRTDERLPAQGEVLRDLRGT